MYTVSLSNGTASEQYANKDGVVKNKCHAIFVDENGAYILTQFKKVYLTKENSIFV